MVFRKRVMARQTNTGEARSGVSDGFEYHVGPEAFAEIDLSEVIVLHQIRQAYDADAIKALTLALDNRDHDPQKKLSVEMIHPPVVDILTRSQFEQYLIDHSEYWGIDLTTPDDYEVGDDGLYRVVVTGNTRTLTLRAMCTNAGVEWSQVGMKINAQNGISFDDANRLQARENTYSAPAPEDIAYSIHREYLHRQRQQQQFVFGHQPVSSSHKSIALHFGCSESKVGDALRYVELPDELRALVEDDERQGLVSFSTALLFHPFMDAYVKHYSTTKDDARVTDEVMILVSQFLNGKLSVGRSVKDLEALIKKRVEGLTAKHGMDALFIVEEAPKARRKKASRKLAGTALGALEFAVLESDDINPELIERIMNLAAKLGAKTVETEISRMDSLFDTV